MRASKIDANQPEIVAALRKVGATVHSTAGVAKGFPDLTVGYKRATYLLEVKDGSKPASRRELTPAEQTVYLQLKTVAPECIHIVYDVPGALSAIGANKICSPNQKGAYLIDIL